MTQTIDRIAILGAGAWGTALALVLAEAGRRVTLYARDENLANDMTKTRRNAVYLPDAELPAGIAVTSDPALAVKDARLVLLATPAQFLRGTLAQFRPHLPEAVPLVNCAKGIETGTGRLLSEIAHEEAAGHPYAVLSGPTFASEIARGMPAAATLATKAEEGLNWAVALRGKNFRPYLSKDPAGAEVSGALKNVIAIACGIVEGRNLGQNARAAVMTRGMAEIKRLGLLKGALPETFLGLSGLGDLTLTCNSMSSRNFSLGVEVGQGKSLSRILGDRRTVAEGVATAKAVAVLSAKEKADMPICLAVDHILHGGGRVDEVIAGLLSRDLKSEAS